MSTNGYMRHNPSLCGLDRMFRAVRGVGSAWGGTTATFGASHRGVLGDWGVLQVGVNPGGLVSSRVTDWAVELGYVDGPSAGEVAKPSGGGGRITIDLEHVPAVVHELDDVILELKAMGRDARLLTYGQAPGLDAFSAYAAQSFSELAVGGVGNHADAHRAYVDVLIATRGRLVQAFIQYKGADAAAAAGMSVQASPL